MPSSSSPKKNPLKAIFLALLIVLLGLAAGLAAFSGALDPVLKAAGLAQYTADGSAPTQAAPAQDVKANKSDASKSDANKAAVKDSKAENAYPVDSKHKAQLADYSFAELAEISSEMKKAGSPEKAKEVAKAYHLLNPDGTFTENTKTFSTKDGHKVSIILVGIMHDKLTADGSLAGLSFLTSSVYDKRPMNAQSRVEGGWKGSGMRGWLNSEIIYKLPKDLSSVIKVVNKQTNNKGESKSTKDVTTSSERLWLPSATEIAGKISWNTHASGAQFTAYDEVLNAEGTQYAYFAQHKVSAFSDPDHVLKRKWEGAAIGWFYRSPYPFLYKTMSQRYFYGALESGYPEGQFEANSAKGVVFGFSI